MKKNIGNFQFPGSERAADTRDTVIALAAVVGTHMSCHAVPRRTVHAT